MTAQKVITNARHETLLTFGTDSPDGFSTIVCHQHTSICQHSYTYRSSVNFVLTFISNKACKKIFRCTGLTIIEGNENNFIAGKNRSVPGTMLAYKCSVLIFFGEAFTSI